MKTVVTEHKRNVPKTYHKGYHDVEIELDGSNTALVELRMTKYRIIVTNRPVEQVPVLDAIVQNLRELLS